MQNRYTLPLLSALVVAASLASCQRKAEEPVVSPGAGRGQVWFEVSESPMGGETKAAPATLETFTTSHESFGVVGYAYASPSTKTRDASDAMEVSYVSERNRWEPATRVWYSFTGNLLEFYAWYPYDADADAVSVTAPESIDGTTTYPTITYTVPLSVADQKDLMVAVASDMPDSPPTDDPVQLTFRHMLTAVKFSIGKYTTCSSITLSGIPRRGTLDMKTGAWSSVDTPADFALTSSPLSPPFGSADASGQCPIRDEFTLMLIPQTLPAGATLTAETSAGTITVPLAGQEWEAGKTVTYRLTAPAPFPVSPFSVSETKTVRFSPGNLQAVFASAGNSFTWQFAENQWNYVGKAAANTKINGNGSVSAAGTVDLFGWSTNATRYGINNSKEQTGYSGNFRDWGNALGSGWRTLSSAEWTYLLSTRTTRDGNRYCKATVNSVSGLVIFPDDYYHPAGVTAPASGGYGSNIWSGNDWTAMEDAGCVFLPAAGGRNASTEFYSTGTGGVYWSSTSGGTIDAYFMSFTSSGLNPAESHRRYSGRSVRLVREL